MPHSELGMRDEYVNEVKKTIGDPDYVVSGWFGEYLALRFCDVACARKLSIAEQV